MLCYFNNLPARAFSVAYIPYQHHICLINFLFNFAGVLRPGFARLQVVTPFEVLLQLLPIAPRTAHITFVSVSFSSIRSSSNLPFGHRDFDFNFLIHTSSVRFNLWWNYAGFYFFQFGYGFLASFFTSLAEGIK
jgi:hypothetical protein